MRAGQTLLKSPTTKCILYGTSVDFDMCSHFLGSFSVLGEQLIKSMFSWVSSFMMALAGQRNTHFPNLKQGTDSVHWEWAFETSELCPSGMPLPMRLNCQSFLILPTRTKYSNIGGFGCHCHSNHSPCAHHSLRADCSSGVP